jgi:sec-independent protein translocase protein TatB
MLQPVLQPRHQTADLPKCFVGLLRSRWIYCNATVTTGTRSACGIERIDRLAQSPGESPLQPPPTLGYTGRCKFVSKLRGKVSWSFMGIHPTIEVATVSMWDTMILMVMALVVFGPRRLPKIGRQIGKLMYEFRKASNDFRFQMEEEMRLAEEADRRKREEEERQRALAAAPPAPAQLSGPAEPADALPPPAAGRAEEYLADTESDSPSSYEEAAYDHYRNPPPDPESEADTKTAPPLRVQPPDTGAPVPAASPTSRATAPPAPAAEPTKEALPAPESPELPPSGNQGAASHPENLNGHSRAPENPPAKEAGVETEPATHHG